MVTFPRLPRRLTFSDFIEIWLPRLFSSFCEGIIPAAAAKVVVQLNGAGGGSYLLTVAETGQLQITPGVSDSAVVLSLDLPAFKSLYDLLSQQYTILARKNGLEKFREKWQLRYHGVLTNWSRLTRLADSQAALITADFVDELQEKRQLQVTLGRADAVACRVNVKCDFSKITALDFSSFSFSGDEDYVARIIRIFG